MSALHLSDKKLIERMLERDEQAFEEFFESYFPGLFRFAMSRLDGNQTLAEEITQATLCKAIRKLATYRGEAALFTWLCTFCRREISDSFARARRREQVVQRIEDVPEIRAALESMADPDEGTVARMRRQEIARWVQITLDHLPRHYGQVLEWKYMRDLSVKEIANRLEIRPKAAESLLTRARQAFRKSFGGMSVGEERLQAGGPSGSR